MVSRSSFAHSDLLFKFLLFNQSSLYEKIQEHPFLAVSPTFPSHIFQLYDFSVSRWEELVFSRQRYLFVGKF